MKPLTPSQLEIVIDLFIHLSRIPPSQEQPKEETNILKCLKRFERYGYDVGYLHDYIPMINRYRGEHYESPFLPAKRTDLD